MIAWALKNALPISAGALLVGSMGFALHTLAMNHQKASYELKLAGQRVALTQQCDASKAITEGVSNEYQKKLAVRDGSLARARRLLNAKCTAAVVVSPSAGHHATAVEGKPAGQDAGGLRASANDLIDIAADGERYRLQLIGCQAFVEKSRSARPQ